jgi:hypothetical protein
MRKIVQYSAIALILAGCRDGTASSIATTVTVAPVSFSLNAIGATRVVRATVADQNGKAMRGAALAWSSSSAAATVAGAGGDSAIVTATGNGAASISATSGSVSGAVAVEVAQTASVLQKAGGDAQTGAAGVALPQPLRVVVRDRLNAPVAGVTVSFDAFGGGSASAATAVTAADGSASVTWTLSPVAGTGPYLRASVAGAGEVLFNAVGVAGAAAAALLNNGNGQVTAPGAAVAIAPRVQVLDAFGNAVAGVAVLFTVTSGGGSVTGASQTTNENGLASPDSWMVGPVVGTHTITATFPGTALPPVVFSATSLDVGTIVLTSGDNQGAMAGTAVPVTPSVVVYNLAGRAPGVTVTFSVTGGGRVVNATATTDANGVASPGSWVLGAVGGPNTLTASVSAVSAPPVTARAIGCEGGGGAGYALTLCFTSSMTASQRAVFRSAAQRWESIITGDVPDAAGTVPAGSCGANPTLDMTFDDLVIFASVEPIDGPGAVLGAAGWCYRRVGGLPVAGLMFFDEADVASLEAAGSFGSVILHEMGHVLGIGTLWSNLGLLQNPSSGGSVLDTYFSGASGIAGFEAIGGSTYTGGQKVPVENTGGPGTANGHWRESVLVNELMTGYLNSGSNPLSLLTVRSLTDLGYVVNPAAADPFSLTLSLRQGPGGPTLKLHNDLYRGPRHTMDRHGRIAPIRN